MIDVSKADRIPGFMEIDELKWLAEMASVRMNILEIGSWKGRSSRAMADNMQEGAEITIIDSFVDGYLEGQNLRETFENNLLDHLEAGRIKIIQATSDIAAGILSKFPSRFDMIFVDGEHFYEYAYNDIKNYLPLLSDRGLFC